MIEHVALVPGTPSVRLHHSNGRVAGRAWITKGEVHPICSMDIFHTWPNTTDLNRGRPMNEWIRRTFSNQLTPTISQIRYSLPDSLKLYIGNRIPIVGEVLWNDELSTNCGEISGTVIVIMMMVCHQQVGSIS